MKFNINRNQLLQSLQLIMGVVERRHTMPVLSNILITIEKGFIKLMASDSEVQIQVDVKCESAEDEGEITIPAKKLYDITRSLPENALIRVNCQDNKAEILSDASQFVLSTLSGNEFPTIKLTEPHELLRISVAQDQLKQLLNKTCFAMAQQDVRFYLNGSLFEITNNSLRLVATDGHRLATSKIDIETSTNEVLQNILPRKAVLELEKLLEDSPGLIDIIFSDSVFSIKTDRYSFISKLIDGKFPDYNKVIPESSDSERIIECDREKLRQTFLRVAILSNEKYRGLRFNIKDSILIISASNPEQEQAEEQVNVIYNSEEEVVDLGFNVSYLLDIINTDNSEKFIIKLSENNSAIIEQQSQYCDSLYVIMPMRL